MCQSNFKLFKIKDLKLVEFIETIHFIIFEKYSVEQVS